MVHFVGAGCGAPDLITVRGQRLLQAADQVIYAGSLINPALLSVTKANCHLWDSSTMTLEDVISKVQAAEREGKDTVRLHTGDPSLYGAIHEQAKALDALGIAYDLCPGVSAFSGAAASLGAEYTLPGVSQTLIICRMEGRTPVPEMEKLHLLSSHRASMAIYLSAGMLQEVQTALLVHYPEDTSAAIVYKATWPEEKVIKCTVGTLAQSGQRAGIDRLALILVGQFLDGNGQRSKLYDPAFETMYREAQQK